ncbi:MAG: MmgE/PrpD family protein [Rhodospirillaceae bacterium]
MTIAATLATKLCATRYADIPKAAVAWAKTAILDTVGVMLAGSRHEAAGIMREVMLESGSRGPCLVVGTTRRIAALDAAQANGTAAHVLDYDDSNSQLMGHPSAAILPALLAASETARVDGQGFIAAYVAGFETLARVGMLVNPYHYAHGWHPTVTVGIFGATAACCHVLGLDEAQTTHAIGMAAHMAAGIKASFGSMTKSLGVGQVARNALLAAQLAAKGYTSGARAFEHHHGYLNVFNGEGNYADASVLERWGDPWCILDMGVKQKRCPCCFACMPAMDCMLALVERHGLRPQDVASIECEVHRIRYPHINVPDPRTGLEAKFSVHYCLARALIDGMLKIEHFEGEGYADAAVRELMQRVSFSSYEGENYSGATVSVTTGAGEKHSVSVEKALGAGYDHPLPADVVRRKFEDCAGRVLSPRRVGSLCERLGSLETVRDIREVTDLMRPRAGSARGYNEVKNGERHYA